MKIKYLITSVFLFACCLNLSAVEVTKEAIAAEEKNMKDSLATAQQWLALMDQNKYGESWDQGTIILKTTLSRNEWIKAQEKLRQPLGKVVKRELATQRPSKNPNKLPPGDYMVIFYDTKFEKKNAHELITLVLTNEGRWKVLTYHVN